MRVIVLGAEHPDEEETTKVVESLIKYEVSNVKGTLINLLGLKSRRRVVDINMIAAYANADLKSNKYEE